MTTTYQITQEQLQNLLAQAENKNKKQIPQIKVELPKIKPSKNFGRTTTIILSFAVAYLATKGLSDNGNLSAVFIGGFFILGIVIAVNNSFYGKTERVIIEKKTINPDPPGGDPNGGITPRIETIQREKLTIDDLARKFADNPKMVNKLKNFDAVKRNLAQDLMAQEIKLSEIKL